MSSLIDVATAAKYNEWANNRLYNALHNLTDGERREDRGAFFRSIHNTMNHIHLFLESRAVLLFLFYREE